MQNDDKFKVMGTKVSPHAEARVNRLAKKKGLSVYVMVQMVIDTILRYCDDRHNLTPEMELAMSVFEHMSGWKDAFNLADPTAEKEVGEATYFLFDPTGKKKGCRAVHVKRPFFGNWEEDVNIQHIIERTINLITPERYVRLRQLAVDMDCNSILQLIDVLLDHHSHEADMAAMRKDFEDADRSEFGIKPKTDGPYKRHHGKQLNFINDETK